MKSIAKRDHPILSKVKNQIINCSNQIVSKKNFKMNLFIKQFNILLWKCWMLKRRHYIATFFEFFLPLLTSITLVLTFSSFAPSDAVKDNKSYEVEPTIYNKSVYDLNENLKKLVQNTKNVTIMIGPQNSCTDRFMNSFDIELRSRSNIKVETIIYEKFKTKEEMDLFYGQFKNDSDTQLIIGIFFNNECTQYDHFLKHFSFTIKTLSPPTLNIAKLFPEKRNAEPASNNFYLDTASAFDINGRIGFLEAQNLVNLVYLKQVKQIQHSKKKFTINNVIAYKYPYPSYISRPPITLIDFIPSVLIYGFIVFFPIVVMRQTSESFSRVREMFKLMGLNDLAYYGSTFVCYLIQLFLQSILLTFLYCFKFNRSVSVFNNSNPLLVFIIILLYGINLILLGFLVSIPFKKPVIATVMSVVIYIFTDTLHYFIDPKYNLSITSDSINSIQLLSCLLPNSSINFIMKILSTLEIYSSGAHFSNLFETTYQYGSLSVGLIIGMNFVSIILYSILIWYLDAVWPYQYGIIKPWYFPVKSILKLFKKEKSIEQKIDQMTTNDLKYFEKENTKNKIKISVENLTKKFGQKTVISNINLKLHENQLTALLGPNSAGKTTLMNMITGLYPPTSGKVLIDNFNIQHHPKKARKSLSLCPQHNILYDELTAYEHLILYGIIKGKSTVEELEKEIDYLLTKLNLKSNKELVSSYSGGMKRKLNLAIALVGKSKIVILDEPTSGMDPESRRVVWDFLLKEKRNRTILLTTHFIEESDVLGDRIFIISNGKARCHGSPLFIKNIFGIGYQLRIAKDLRYNASSEARVKLNDFIKQYFKNSVILNENVGEVIYLLNANEENLKKPVFPDFFKNFELIKGDLNISTFGITITTLEDVFLKIVNLTTTDAITEPKNQISVSSGYDSSYNLTGTSLNASMHSESIVPFLEDTSQKDKIRNEFLLLLQRFKGLLFKRLNHSKRFYPMIIFQVLIPILIFWLILFLDNYLEPNWTEKKSFVLENELYGETKGFFKDNTDDPDLFESYNSTSANPLMKVTRLDWDQNPNDYLLDISKKVTISTYIKTELYGAVVRKLKSDENLYESIFNLEIWLNNEASHSTPLSVAGMFNALLRYIGDQETTEYQKIQLTSEPFPNEFFFSIKFFVIYAKKIMWSLLVSLSLPFLAASFSMFPIHEYITKSKLLQKMAGANSYLYWFSTFIYDVITHSIVCSLILLIVYLQDTNEIFYIFGPSMSGLFLLLFLFGLASMQICYCFSRLFDSIGSGFLIIVVFNLIFGVVLAVIDYLFTFLTQSGFISKYTLDVLLWLFRIFPIYSMSKGVTNLYMDGSVAHFCDNLSDTYLSSNCRRMPVLKGCCKNLCDELCYIYKDPFVWDSDKGIMMEIFTMGLVFTIAFIANFAIEEKIIKKLITLIPNRNQANSNNVLLISSNRVERYLENSSEDADVIQEKRRVETLVDQSNKNNLPQSMLVHHLTKIFNKFIAVDDLSFALDERECFGLLGVNGAGKTTTFRMLVGDLEPTDGTAFIKDFNLKSDLNNFQKNIGYCPQFDALLDNLTGEEMLYLFGRLRGIKERNLKYTVDCIVRMVNLSEHSKFVCSDYSGGNKRKLSLGIALIGLPKIIFLDEPTSGVDAEARRKIWKTLVTIKEKFNCSIVLTSHSMDECEALCSRIAIMVAGKFKCLNSVQNLRQKYGKGYTLTIKLKPVCLDKPMYLKKLRQKIREVFPSAILKDQHETLISYQIEDNSLKWSFLFNEMQKIKETFNLEYYLLSDCTLEQIFINFAKTNQLAM